MMHCPCCSKDRPADEDNITNSHHEYMKNTTEELWLIENSNVCTRRKPQLMNLTPGLPRPKVDLVWSQLILYKIPSTREL